MDANQSDESSVVRLLGPADAGAYRAVRVRALQETPPAFGSLASDEPDLAATAARLQDDGERCFFGTFHGGELTGIVRLSRHEAPTERHRAYLGGLYVVPAFRGRGHGRALVCAALGRAESTPEIRRVNLSVVTGQTAAIALYESLGFHLYGTEQAAFCKDGRFYDEHLMTLDLATTRRA